jgi:hypothetical protein
MSACPVVFQFNYRVKIINPLKKKDSAIRDIRRFNGKFTSVTDVKVRLMEEFEGQVPDFQLAILKGGNQQKSGLSQKMILQQCMLP